LRNVVRLSRASFIHPHTQKRTKQEKHKERKIEALIYIYIYNGRLHGENVEEREVIIKGTV
jgi:hypothetical protein